MDLDKIDKGIFEYLKEIEFSATTQMVAENVGVAWYTAQMHLQELRDLSKVDYYKVGRQNQWILSSRIKED